MKNVICSFLLFLSVTIYCQTGDGWDNRVIDTYENDVEKARISITFIPGFDTEGHLFFDAIIDPDLPFNGGISATDGEFNLNYIRTYTPLFNHMTTEIPSHNSFDYSDWAENIVYYDGQGREIQKIAVKGSPVQSDIIQPVIYDEYGRLKVEHLRYAITQGGSNGPGGFRPDPINEKMEFYGFYYPNDYEYSYSNTVFDDSPLNRILKQYPPGEVWKENGGNPVEFKYLTNDNSEIPYLNIRTDHYLEKSGYYSPGSLFKNITNDENGNSDIEFKDKLGRIVAKIITSFENPGTTLETYYVYDNFGKLRFVISPKASDYIKNHASGTIGHFNTNATIQQLCYYYQYDERLRMIIKKLPGAQPVYLVYNKRDQLVLTQDGNLRANNDWLFTKYDVFNRQIMTGKYHHISNIGQEQMQDEVNEYEVGNEFHYFEIVDLTADHGYENKAFPDITSAGCEVYTVTYYDNYNYINQYYNEKYNFQNNEINFLHPLAENVKGYVTATKTNILPNSDITIESGIEYLIQANYYDKYYSLIQTITDNHSGGLDITSSKINFTGDILLTKENHSFNEQSIIVQNQFEYDNGKRLVKTKHKINNESWITICEQKFDELGRLKRKYLHGSSNNSLQTINYNYNIRNWITDINDISDLENDLFALKLGYTSGTYPQYNGNIASLNWNTSMFGNNTYNFNYDEANRLIQAEYNGNGNHTSAYEYDFNGNILSLTREGQLGGSSEYASIDDLNYAYIGNQLRNVHDILDDNHQNNGFSDNGSFGNNEYSYDANGNMISDLNKSLTIEEYNYLNLPQNLSLSESGFDKINYLYNATGIKLRKQTRVNFAIEKTMDYIGNFVYDDDDLKYILTSEGRVMVNLDQTYDYQYFLKDHLGNTRITFNQDGILIQEDSYYPFGMQMDGLCYETGLNFNNKYLYNGKELQDDFELGWYDYGARFYGPQLGRWFSIDPMAEKYYLWSPYNYTLNNPICLLDLDGREPTPKEAIALVKHINSYFSKNIELVGGWELERSYDYRKQSGFTAGLYSRVKDDGNIEYSFVTRGSDLDFSKANIESTIKDWKNNLNQLKGATEQYKQSVEIAKKINSNIEEELTFLGQSLGGGLASANALATGRRGITFSAAGLSDKIIKDLSLNNKSANITAWIIKGEIVDYLQSRIPGVNRAYGRRVELMPSLPYVPGISPAFKTIQLIQRTKNHFIEAYDGIFEK